MTIQELHRKAMREVDKALAYREHGEGYQSLLSFEKAFKLEKKAALLSREEKVGEPTESILLRSAASLAIDAKCFADAQDLITLALRNKPPLEIADELNSLYLNKGFQKYLNAQPAKSAKSKAADILTYTDDERMSKRVSMVSEPLLTYHSNPDNLLQSLSDAGAHFGHLKTKWSPKMLPYIIGDKKGIHLIDLNKTAENLQEAAAVLNNIARKGKKILFVATKKQAKDVVRRLAADIQMPFVTERWSRGMLSNFLTVRKSIAKMEAQKRLLHEGSFNRTERLRMIKDYEKTRKMLEGLIEMDKLPAAIFCVDIGIEHVAIAEAKRLGIITVGIVDTNCDPDKVDFPIPANDDSTKSIAFITQYLATAISKGLENKKSGSSRTEAEDIALPKSRAGSRSERETPANPKTGVARNRRQRF